MILSLLFYYPIVYLTKKIFNKTNLFSLLVTGFFLTLTTPIIYLSFDLLEFSNYLAIIIAWILCFTISIFSYYMFNKGALKSEKLESETTNGKFG